MMLLALRWSRSMALVLDSTLLNDDLDAKEEKLQFSWYQNKNNEHFRHYIIHIPVLLNLTVKETLVTYSWITIYVDHKV